jgi:uncharacterized protein (UPF0332 family)
MSFDWSDFLTLADALTDSDGNGDREASLRTAISRAYYAAFGVARLRLRSVRQATRRSAAEHGEIATFYATRYGEPGAEVAAVLGRLRNRRNAADYDDEFAAVEQICDLSIEDARYLLALLDTL